MKFWHVLFVHLVISTEILDGSGDFADCDGTSCDLNVRFPTLAIRLTTYGDHSFDLSQIIPLCNTLSQKEMAHICTL